MKSPADVQRRSDVLRMRKKFLILQKFLDCKVDTAARTSRLLYFIFN